MHKAPRAESNAWFDRKPGIANDTEVLFFALLILSSGERADTLDDWADTVLRPNEASYLSEGAAAWKIPAEWKGLRNQKAPIMNIVLEAYDASRDADELNRIGAALQAWRGKGQCSGLEQHHLRQHFSWARELRGKKRAGVLMERLQRSLVAVAALVKSRRSGSQLRTLLKLHESAHQAPSPVEELADAKRKAEKLEEQLEECRAEKKRCQDGWTASAKRNKDQRAACKLLRAAERQAAAKAKKEAKLKQRERFDARTKLARNKLVEKLRAEAVEREAAERQKLQKRLAAARKRARDTEYQASLSVKRLERAKGAEAALKNLQATLEEEESEGEEEPAVAESEGQQDAAQGSWQPRRDALGRFGAMPWRVRVLVWSQLSRRVPPGAVGANISQVVEMLAPAERSPVPSEPQIRRMRGELTIAGEAMAAFRVALCKRIVSFGWDESTKFGLNLLSSNTQIEPHDEPAGKLVDVVMRGATLTAGGTAAAIAQSIDRNIFSHGRRLIEGWLQQHEKMYGEGSWGRAGGPSPESLGMHRLSEHACLMTDTCNAARLCQKLVAQAAEEAGMARIGEEAWAKLTSTERAARCKTYIGYCHQHLRNIIINSQQHAATELLTEKLQESLAEFSSFDRMSVDGNDLIRAIFKELHGGGEYAKGKGREFVAWLKKHYPDCKFLAFVCANGSRQDIAFDGAVPIFLNRTIILEFLNSLVHPKCDNKLDLFLWRVLGCNEMTALLRVNTLWKYVFSEPARWLAGCSGEMHDWSIESSSGVMDLIEKAMIEIAADGRKLLDPTFDPFASLAAKQPAFAKWRREHMEATKLALDGRPYPIHQLAIDEARQPTGAGNKQAEQTVIELASKMANGALVAMRDPRRAIMSLLSSQDGEFCVGKDPRVHEATKGAHVTNDRVESNFGCVDVLMRMFRYATVANVSGMAQQMRNCDFEQPPAVASDRRKRKVSGEEAPPQSGFFHRLTPELQQSLVEYARLNVASARKDGAAALTAHDEDKLRRREERLADALVKVVDQYAYAKELYAAWQAGGASSKEQVTKYLRGKPETEQLEYLRKQIEMRVLGLGWTQYATRWSSQADQRIGTVSHLQELLEEIIVEERAQRRLKRLPTEAALPNQLDQNLGQLGTADADAAAIERRCVFSLAELERKAQLAMERRAAAGVSDSLEDLNAGVNGGLAPAFDQSLVGKQIEVLWKYVDAETQQPHLIWASGRVARVADGLTDKRSARARNLLPAGAVLWQWDADPEFDERAGEKWLVLLPSKWNSQVLYGWRYDAREFGAECASTPDERRKTMRRVVDDE